MSANFLSYGQPVPQYSYTDRYAHPHKSNFSAQFKFGFAALNGSNCKLTSPKDQNYFLNPRATLGLGYQYTHYINFLFRAGYFRYSCDTPSGNDGVRGANFDGYLAVKHYFFPYRDYDDINRKYNFYGLAGIGTMYLNPKDATTNEPFSETVDFNRWALMAPLGVGAELKLSEFFLMDLELNYFFTNAEYLDGKPSSQILPGQNRTDNFLSLGVNVIYQLPNKEFTYKKFLRYKSKEDKL